MRTSLHDCECNACASAGLILLAVDCDSRPFWGKANQAMPGHPAWSGILRGDGGFSACSGEREFVLFFDQVVAAANCCNHFQDDVSASRCAVSRFERTGVPRPGRRRRKRVDACDRVDQCTSIADFFRSLGENPQRCLRG
jgi:hypothetical protein